MPQEDNAFAEYGTFCHKLLEEWALGKLLSFELADAFAAGYDAAVQHYFPPFPRDMGQRYYDAGLRFFTGFDGFGNQEILAVEDRFQIELTGSSLVGVVDLVLRDRESGSLTVIDHKSKSMSTMRKDLTIYRKQLYLYAAAVMQRFGQAPSLLQFNLFRERTTVDESFDMLAYQETMAWVDQTIDTISKDHTWAHPDKPDYFCKYICSVRQHCPMMLDSNSRG